MLKTLALALALTAVPTLARADTLGAEKVDDHKKDEKKDEHKDHKDDHKKDDKKDDHKDHKDDHHDDAHKAKPKH